MGIANWHAQGYEAAPDAEIVALCDLDLDPARIFQSAHGGDLHGRELKALIEEAGPEYVGACPDSGGVFESGESPFVTLEHLAPYVAASHVRDTVIWEHPRGAAIQSVALGEGNVGIDRWARLFEEMCGDGAFTLEVITGGPPRVINYLEPAFWEAYPGTPAAEFARFVKLAHEGGPFMGAKLTVDGGEELPSEYVAALRLQQRLDLEQSVRYCQDGLGFGERRAAAQ